MSGFTTRRARATTRSCVREPVRLGDHVMFSRSLASRAARRASCAASSARPPWIASATLLGYFDDETCRLEPIENPFGPKVLPMSSE